jgi:hypothetical protein
MKGVSGGGVYVVLCWLEIKRFDMQRVKEVEIV